MQAPPDPGDLGLLPAAPELTGVRLSRTAGADSPARPAGSAAWRRECVACQETLGKSLCVQWPPCRHTQKTSDPGGPQGPLSGWRRPIPAIPEPQFAGGGDPVGGMRAISGAETGGGFCATISAHHPLCTAGLGAGPVSTLALWMRTRGRGWSLSCRSSVGTV